MGLAPDGLARGRSDAESTMGPTTAPVLSILATLAAGMLMLLSGVKKRKLAWRARPADRRRGLRGRRRRT